ncbi:hypothetical protein STEG23_001935, partial [Scotinomys teguina]
CFCQAFCYRDKKNDEDSLQFLPCKCVRGSSGNEREAEAWTDPSVHVRLLLRAPQSPSVFNTSSSLRRS